MIPVKELLELFPPELLDRLAIALGVNAPNQIRLTGQAVFVCLLNGLVNHPLLTQQLLAEHYEQFTGQSVDRSSFSKRFDQLSPDYFAALFAHLYRKVQPQMTSGDAAALRLRIVDATTVTLSAKLLHFGLHFRSGGRAGPNHPKRHIKSVWELEPDGLPNLLHLCREPKETDDNAALGDPMIEAAKPGDLFLFDGGCRDRDRLLRLHQKQAFFLTPLTSQKLRPLQTLWQEGLVAGGDLAAPAKVGEEYRLLRVEQAVFENANDAVSPSKQQKWASMPLVVLYGERYDGRSKSWKPLVLLTNLALSEEEDRAGPYTFAELAELYRLRWQIEVFFKFLKQQLSYDHLTSYSENGIEVTVRMALIVAVLLIWYRHRTGIDRGWRSVKFWFAEDARAWTQTLLRRDLSPPLKC
jgi:hypothetical protein